MLINYLAVGLFALSFAQEWEFVFRASEPRSTTLRVWTGTRKTAITKATRAYLGPYGNDSIVAHIQDIPAHDSIIIELEVFILGSWDGVVDDDYLTILLDSKDTLLSSTFSNTSYSQNYPDRRGGNQYPRRTGATAVDCTGWLFREAKVFDGPLDAAYTFTYKVPHTSKECSISIISVLKDVRPIPENEAWGISMLRIATIRNPVHTDRAEPLVVPGR